VVESGTVDDIDPWVGALAEDHLPGSSLGPLLTAGVLDQFLRTRAGDRFWYQNDPELADILATIESTTLSEIILRNSSITNLQANAFFIPAHTGDVNGDLRVDIDDLLEVINSWGACPMPCLPQCAADLNGDCTVNIDDLLAVINSWE
jgi:hypothetical protein